MAQQLFFFFYFYFLNNNIIITSNKIMWGITGATKRLVGKGKVSIRDIRLKGV